MAKVLEVRELSKRYGPGCRACTGDGAWDGNHCPSCGTVCALRDISFDVYAGEIVGIMGESGSGKSTLLRTLFLEEPPTAGRALFRDGAEAHALFDLNPGRARQLRNRRFGIVHQNPRLGLNFDITAGGNIAAQLLVAGHTHFGRVRRRAEELLDRTHVPVARIDQSPRTYSGGMQQRLQIAKALATRPPMLFLDEVTTGLDLSVQARILDLILELHQQLQLSMLVVSHDIGVVKLLASQTLIMRQGRVVESGLTDQILQDPQHPYTQELISAAL